MLPDATLVETAVHEAGHAIAMLSLGTRLREIVVEQSGAGRCLGNPVRGLPLPRPWEPRAIAHCASDFIGVIATGKAFSYRTETDNDFRAHGGCGDIENFYRRADLLGCDAGETAALRHLAIEAAHGIIFEYAEAIDAVADHLYVYRRLGHDQVVNVIRGTSCADRLLAAQMPAQAHRVVSPWAVTCRDGRLVEVDEHGVVRRIVTRPARLRRE